MIAVDLLPTVDRPARRVVVLDHSELRERSFAALSGPPTEEVDPLFRRDRDTDAIDRQPDSDLDSDEGNRGASLEVRSANEARARLVVGALHVEADAANRRDGWVGWSGHEQTMTPIRARGQ